MTTVLDIKLLYTDPATAEAFDDAIDSSEWELDSIAFERGNRPEQMLSDANIDVVLYEFEGHSQADIALLQEYIETHPDVRVFVVYKNLDMDSMRQFMRAGVHDTIPLPLDRDEFRGNMSELLNRKREAMDEAKGKIFAFMNAKGGSGATTLAVNMAHELAARQNARVAIIDLDIQFGDVALFLDLPNRSTVLEALSQASRLDVTMLDAVMEKHGSGLSVLASPGGLARVTDIASRDVRRLVDVAADAYDVVILDLPRLFNDWTEEVLRISDHVMLVMTSSLSTLRDAKTIVDQFPAINIAVDKVEVLLNRAESRHGSVNEKQIEEALRIERIATFHNDFTAAISAQDQGQPLSRVAPKSKLTKDIEALAEVAAAHIQNRAPRKAGFFERIFKGRKASA